MKVVSFLVPFLFGLIGIFSFAPFSIKLLLFISYAYLIYIILYSKEDNFIKVFLWGIGHWGFGMSWIIVSVYYYGETSIATSSIIYILLVIILSLVFTCPLLLIRVFLNSFKINNNFYKSLVVSSLLMLGEFSRYYLLNGVPWLIPGNIYLDTITQNIYPLFGVSFSSLLIYLLCSNIVISYHDKKRYYLIIFFILVTIFPNHKEINNINDGIQVSIVQPPSDPFLKYKSDYYNQIERNLLDLISSTSDKSELIVLPEAELPYLINSNRFEEFLKRASQTDKLVMGGWYIDNNLIYNSIFSIKSGDLYKKNHLVPFGEYIPFISGLRGIIGFFDLPMSNVSQGGSDQPNIIINETISLATPICFDIAFPNTVRKMNKSSLLMINISNDTWFGNSIGPYQHLSITRIRSIENNRWSIRSTNDGISALISNNGTIVTKLEKGVSGILEGKVGLIKENSLYNMYGYLVTYFFCFIILIITFFNFLCQKYYPK